MKLPLQNSPPITNRDDLVPVRSNIHPTVYEHLFKQLCPLRGTQAQIISLVFDKLHAVILTDPSLDEFRIHKPNGSVAFFYDDGVLTKLAAIVDRCNFDLRPSGDLTDRAPDSEHVPGRIEGNGDALADATDVRPDPTSNTGEITDEGVKRLAQAIFR